MNWDKLIDFFQEGMIFFLIIVVVVCVMVLISFDVLAGTGIMMYLTNDKVKESIFISLATSGLLMSLMLAGYTLISGDKKAVRGVGWLVLLGGFSVYCLDVYFDSLTADYLRFGKIVALNSLPKDDIQVLFRFLIGGISTVGELLAISIILGMPVLKNLVSDALPKNQEKKQQQKAPSHSHSLRFQRKRGEVLDRLPKG